MANLQVQLWCTAISWCKKCCYTIKVTPFVHQCTRWHLQFVWCSVIVMYHRWIVTHVLYNLKENVGGRLNLSPPLSILPLAVILTNYRVMLCPFHWPFKLYWTLTSHYLGHHKCLGCWDFVTNWMWHWWWSIWIRGCVLLPLVPNYLVFVIIIILSQIKQFCFVWFSIYRTKPTIFVFNIYTEQVLELDLLDIFLYHWHNKILTQNTPWQTLLFLNK